MDTLPSAPLTKTQLLFARPSLTPTFALQRYRYSKTPSPNPPHRLLFIFKTPPFASPPLSYPLQISSHIRQPTKRRNSLRKKLMDNEGKVRSDVEFSNIPSPNFNIPNLNYNEINRPHFDSDVENSKRNYFDGFNGGSNDESAESLDLSGDSAMWGKLENWVDQYRKDNELWGVGSSPIFTVYQDVNGNVNRVCVDRDEIIRRSGFKKVDFESPELVSSKVSYAEGIARKVESGEFEFPKNSSVAKYVVQSKWASFVDGFCCPVLHKVPSFKLSQIGFGILCGCLIIWVAKELFVGGKEEVELTREEEEMLRRKIRLRMERENMKSGSVEVVANDLSFDALEKLIERPKLDNDLLMKSILKAKAENRNLANAEVSGSLPVYSSDFNAKILEIREMARQAREFEQQVLSKGEDGKGDGVKAIKEETDINDSHDGEKISNVVKMSESDSELYSVSRLKSARSLSSNHVIHKTSADTTVDEDIEHSSGSPAGCDEKTISQSNITTSGMDFLEIDAKVIQDPDYEGVNMNHMSSSNEEQQSHESSSKSKNPVKMRPRIIRSVEEARAYLSQKCNPLDGQHAHQLANEIEANVNKDRAINENGKTSKPSTVNDMSNSKHVLGASGLSSLEKELSEEDRPHLAPNGIDSHQSLKASSSMDPPPMHKDSIGKKHGDANKSWMEENFQELEPIIKKIGVGFQENYMVAKEKVQEQSISSSDVNQLGFKEDDEELEWMKDDDLREIVFQVKENELAGREPFHLMDAKDKEAFIKGLEKKAEKLNEKLLTVHEWVHSRIENLDYGSDVISLDDPLEKIIPRWKGPTIDKDSKFFNDFIEHRNTFRKETIGISNNITKDSQDSIPKVQGPASSSISSSYGIESTRKTQNGASGDPKTVIDSSDGSKRAGKKSGKEHWQHTKKWTREFLEVYNAETDPEVKSIMKDMGKDLDRWITDKDIQEAADLMTQIPKRKRRYIEKKMEKLKREMEMFGPHAVVSKYREYSEEKEEDFLWWLDLPYVLCIELYLKEDDAQKVGFYSLEMAPDLELNPKQYHVVAFEDPGDSKNFCYILQAHLEMGSAFVIARPPKDAFREAKANGFNVTVIRKGQLKLNIDQTLEEAEDEITEIGSKIYHDKIMREHSVDMTGLMKGVFGAGKTTKRRSKRMLTKPSK